MESIIGNIKTSLLILLLLFAANQSHAQFGVRTGVGVADVNFQYLGQGAFLGFENNSLIHNYPSLSFQAGLIHQLELSRRLDLSIGMLYSRQGLDYSGSFIYDKIKYRLNISYLKLPLLLKVKTNIGKNLRSGIIAGPFLSGKLDATMVTRIQGITEKQEKDNVNFLDFGMIGGYSWDIGEEPGHMFIDLRSSFSLINIMQTLDGTPMYTGPEKEFVRNMTIIVAFEFVL